MIYPVYMPVIIYDNSSDKKAERKELGKEISFVGEDGKLVTYVCKGEKEVLILQEDGKVSCGLPEGTNWFGVILLWGFFGYVVYKLLSTMYIDYKENKEFRKAEARAREKSKEILEEIRKR